MLGPLQAGAIGAQQGARRIVHNILAVVESHRPPARVFWQLAHPAIYMLAEIALLIVMAP